MILLSPPPPKTPITVSLVDDLSDNETVASNSRQVGHRRGTSVSSGSQTAYSPSTAPSEDEWYHADQADEESSQDEGGRSAEDQRQRTAAERGGSQRADISRQPAPAHSRPAPSVPAPSTSSKRSLSGSSTSQRGPKRARTARQLKSRYPSSTAGDRHASPNAGTFTPEEDLALYIHRCPEQIGQSWKNVADKLNRKEKVCWTSVQSTCPVVFPMKSDDVQGLTYYCRPVQTDSGNLTRGSGMLS